MPHKEINFLKSNNVSIGPEGSVLSYDTKTKQGWVKLNDLDSLIWDAFVMNEDQKFWEHNGLNYKQIRIALGDYLFGNKPLRGASTITQQLSKNLFLDKSRSWIRKIKEVFIAKKMEKELGKSRILEVYINVVEFGPGTFGISDGANYYFGKSATELTVSEAIYLTSLLPNPKLYNEAKSTGLLTQRDSVEILKTMDRMLIKKKIDTTSYENLRIAPIVFKTNQ